MGAARSEVEVVPAVGPWVVLALGRCRSLAAGGRRPIRARFSRLPPPPSPHREGLPGMVSSSWEAGAPTRPARVREEAEPGGGRSGVAARGRPTYPEADLPLRRPPANP